MSKKKGRLTKIERLELRRQLVSNIARGQSIITVARALIKKPVFKGCVTEAAIYKDWERRETWLPLIMKIDPDKTFEEIMLAIEESRREAWTLYRQALKNKNENAAVGALKLINDSAKNQVELLQSLGKLEKTPTKIDALITSPDGMPFEKLPEVREAMDHIQKRLKAEKGAPEDP